MAYLSPTRLDALPESGLPPSPSLEAFRQSLAELGYVEGENIRVEYRFILEGQQDALPEVAAELVQLNPDLIVALGLARVQAVKQATGTIPIVMAAVSDPVERGLVSSLASPESNLTGVTRISEGLAGKRLQLLKETVPNLARVAVLSLPGWSTPDSPKGREWREVRDAAEALQLDVWVIELKDEGSAPAITAALERAVTQAKNQQADALLPLGDSLLQVYRYELADVALRHGLPTTYSRLEFAEAGGLMAYSPDTLEAYRRVAVYVDKVLKGAKPQELPIERPSRFELAINLQTADQLGIAIPESVLAQATVLVSETPPRARRAQ